MGRKFKAPLTKTKISGSQSEGNFNLNLEYVGKFTFKKGNWFSYQELF